MLDTEITKKLVPTNDVVVGSELAFAPTFQANLRVRQEWEMADGYTGHAQLQVTHSGDSYSDIMGNEQSCATTVQLCRYSCRYE